MKNLLTLVCLSISQVLLAQYISPFASVSKESSPVLTLSNGRYDEFFANDTLVRMGSVLFNTKQDRIERFLDEDDTVSFIAPVKELEGSRFMSKDPLAKGFPWNSPYSYAENQPIWAIDLDGLEKVVVVFRNLHDKTEGMLGNLKALENAGYDGYILHNGADFLSLLELYSSNIPIEDLVIISHSNEVGIIGSGEDNGIYTKEGANAYSRKYGSVNAMLAKTRGITISQIKKQVLQGKIRFDQNATITLGGCNTYSQNSYTWKDDDGNMFSSTPQNSIANQMSDATGKMVYASGYKGPVPGTEGSTEPYPIIKKAGDMSGKPTLERYSHNTWFAIKAATNFSKPLGKTFNLKSKKSYTPNTNAPKTPKPRYGTPRG